MRDEREPYKGVLNREIPIKGLTPNTVNVRLRTLRAMCRFWTNEGYINVNPMEKIKLLKTDSVDDLTGFTDKELRQLFGVLDLRQYSCFRDRIIMMLLLDTGIRINELVNVQMSHLDSKQLTLTIPAEVAKNRKSRTIPISVKVMKLLAELDHENKLYFEPTEYLFLTSYGDKMIPNTFRRRLYKYAEESGVERATPRKGTIRKACKDRRLEKTGTENIIHRIFGNLVQKNIEYMHLMVTLKSVKINECIMKIKKVLPLG